MRQSPCRRDTVAAAMTMTVHDQAMRELLAFYQEAGVDTAIGEMPVDRLSEPETAPAPPPPAAAPSLPAANAVPARPPAAPPRQITARELGNSAALSAPPSPDAAVMAAREAATTAADLDALRAILNGFEGCALRTTATQLVFGRGNPQARVVFIGEA